MKAVFYCCELNEKYIFIPFLCIAMKNSLSLKRFFTFYLKNQFCHKISNLKYDKNKAIHLIYVSTFLPLINHLKYFNIQ